jgi:uncharacterized membrane protein YcaP (DUF421 family)
MIALGTDSPNSVLELEEKFMDAAPVPFDFTRMLIGPAPLLFYLEIIVRIVIVYIYTLLLLRWIGSRTIAQLSTVEFLLVIALGSAVGDAMFYPEVPLLHALLVITGVVLINKGVDILLYRSKTMKTAIDGNAVEVVRNGRIAPDGLSDRSMSVSELHELLRLNGATNLGEIGLAYIEANGQMSVFTLEEPRPGLPLIPLRDMQNEVPIHTPSEFNRGTHYACAHCGITGSPPPSTPEGCCESCGHSGWVPACLGPADQTLGKFKRLYTGKTGKPNNREVSGIAPLAEKAR